MRFFKQGDVLAITLPESIRKKYDVKDGDDYDFIEVEKGFFALVTKEKTSEILKKEVIEKAKLPLTHPAAFIPATQVPVPVTRASASRTGVKQLLELKGFLLLESEDQAKSASVDLEKEIKAGAVRGVRSFDKKFYLASREFFESNAPAVQSALGKSELSASDVSLATKLPLDATLTVLYLLKEEGELIEKKRGLFALVK